MKLKMILSAAVAAAFVDMSAQAQTVTALSPSQYNATEGDATWAFVGGVEGSISFYTNGVASYLSNSQLVFGYATTTWNMTATISSGNVLLVGKTDYDSPSYNWSVNTKLIDFLSTSSISLAAVYNATNNESESIGDITDNGNPIGETLTADQNDPLDAINISPGSGEAVTVLTYTLTIDMPDPSNPDYFDSSGQPAMNDSIFIPNVASIP